MATKYLIVGGTGTLGNELVKQLTRSKANDVTVFSRDELKQSLMRKVYPDVRYILGDIRSYTSIQRACGGVDTVIHVAALKQVDTLEVNPLEAINTNVVGTTNVAYACVNNAVRHCVFSSTDKAVLPINVYGYTKGLAEKILLNMNREQTSTKFSVFRWGNVIGSRGSAIPYFIKTLKKEAKVYITHKDMTRFFITIENATMYLLGNYKKAPKDSALVPIMYATTIVRLCQAIATLCGLKVMTHEFVYTGIRPGEKIHECVWSDHDQCIRSDTAPQFSDQDLLDLLEPIVRDYENRSNW